MAIRSYISVDDFATEEFLQLFTHTAEIKKNLAMNRAAYLDKLCGILGGMMFYEPSTRTSGSFEKAVKRLGGQLYDFNIAASSVAKGESVLDTACMVAGGTEFLIVRHPQQGIGRQIANVINIPVINAGEGTGEHPTQALLDMYTIWERFNKTQVRIGLMGDLLHGRTCHSLIKLGARLGAHFFCIAPIALQMPKEYIAYAESLGCIVSAHETAEEVAGELDVLYITRLQKERLPQALRSQYEIEGSPYNVTPALLAHMPVESIVMHPLPRVDELSVECDTDPRAWYFKQAENGIYTRMALIQHLLSL
ncbi:MAG: aspartate carbamoyltransferase [Alphaproteobacteria bacterium]|nr:aspartate carbamoyltransferase [Alphaproteobacteria bacterium]